MSKLVSPGNLDDFLNSEQLGIVLNDPNNVKLTSQFLIDSYDVRSKIMNS